MSKKIEHVAAIDIGTTKIVAIVGKKEKNGKISILGMGQSDSMGVKRGVVLNIEETSNAIQKAVTQAEQKSGVKIREVFVGIAGQHIKSMKNRHSKYIESQENEISQKDVDTLTEDMQKIALEAGEEIIHVIPQSYIVDNEIGVKKPVGMFGKRLEANFHIVVGQIASARNIYKCVERAGLVIKKIILEPLASSEAVLTDDEKEAGVALIDIGGGTTDLAVYYDGVIRQTAVIPFGGNAITLDLKEAFAILGRHAEKLKKDHGEALADFAKDNKIISIPGISGRGSKEISLKNIADIIQARMEEIIDVFSFEIENSGFYERLGAGIALTGGGSLLKNLTQLIQFRTGLDVRLASPKVQFSNQKSRETIQPMYSTSVGLLMMGYDYYEKNSNEIQQNQENEEIEEQTNDTKETETTRKKGDGFISAIRDSISNIFEEKDSEM